MADSHDDRSVDLTDPVTRDDHCYGRADAPVTIIEYGDYECPDCLNALPVLKEVMHILDGRMRFVFRHFPQSSIHPHASMAAEAAEAAAEQGKFWEMHDALFAHQKELIDIDLTHLALSLGMEVYQFEASRGLQKHQQRIASDHASGVRSGVKGTPTLFINGRRYRGKVEAQAIVAAAEAAMRGAD
jgi:protein-disulfide isomerase